MRASSGSDAHGSGTKEWSHVLRSCICCIARTDKHIACEADLQAMSVSFWLPIQPNTYHKEAEEPTEKVSAVAREDSQGRSVASYWRIITPDLERAQLLQKPFQSPVHADMVDFLRNFFERLQLFEA